jgi:thiamine biosynthesis lipoprotein
MREASASFSCFGSTCAVFVMGSGASEAVDTSRARLVAWHERFTRFDARSELSRLNADPRREVRVSSIMALFVHAVGEAARSTGGLVDATLLGELETSGYRTDLVTSVPLASALASAPARRPAAPLATRRWSEVTVDLERCSVTRPPGLRLDSGGLAKGVLADVLGERLATHASYAVDAAGDLRVGGAGGRARPVQVASPFDGSTLHTLRLADAGVATSGVGRRSWLNARRARSPPARSRHRQARLHRRRPGDCARAHGARGGDPRQGGRAQRPRRRTAVAPPRRRRRPRGRQPTRHRRTRQRPEGAPMHLLVITDETAEGDVLHDTIRQLAPASRDEVTVIAPALSAQFLERLRAGGVSVSGSVGDADPMQAIGHALALAPADELLIATRSEGASRWLERDLVRRACMRFDLPVAHVSVDVRQPSGLVAA